MLLKKGGQHGAIRNGFAGGEGRQRARTILRDGAADTVGRYDSGSRRGWLVRTAIALLVASGIIGLGRRAMTGRHHCRRHGQQQQYCKGKQAHHRRAIIHTAIAIMNRFSVSETKPSGTLLLPPTHAHFSSRLSI